MQIHFPHLISPCCLRKTIPKLVSWSPFPFHQKQQPDLCGGDPMREGGREEGETRDRRYMAANVFADPANRSNKDHPQKVNLTSLFVLWPSDCCCCCPHIDLIHRTMWQQGKEQQVWKGNLFLIWICERVHSFVVINCQRCMTNFYSGDTQQWGSIRGKEGPSHIQSSPPLSSQKKTKRKKNYCSS